MWFKKAFPLKTSHMRALGPFSVPHHWSLKSLKYDLPPLSAHLIVPLITLRNRLSQAKAPMYTASSRVRTGPVISFRAWSQHFD